MCNCVICHEVIRSESESELFTGDTSKDNHLQDLWLGELVPSPHTYTYS